jgi:hypothetical protein
MIPRSTSQRRRRNVAGRVERVVATAWMVGPTRRALRHMKTAWHPLLVVLLEHLLPHEWYRLLPELQLTKEPQRIDTVIIRKRRRVGAPPEPTHLVSVLGGLRAHTIVHFKGPSDELEASDALQLLGYASQYMVLEAILDPSAIALRVIAPTLTPRFAAQVRRMGGSLKVTAQPGVHEGALSMFALRVIETALAYPAEGDHLLYTLSPQYVSRPTDFPTFDDEEKALFLFVAQCVERLRKDPNWSTLVKDAAKVTRSYDEARLAFLKSIPVKDRLAGLTPEQRLDGLPPEQIGRALAPGDLVLALSDEALRALSNDYIQTLPADVQRKVRARRGG